MKVVVINGTQVKGCTYHIKETFLKAIGKDHQIQEFYLPGDFSHFCVGCKKCFEINEQTCPHAHQSLPIWNAMMEADLLVFAYPVYVLRAPGQIKALLDHFGCHWIVHRPKEAMFSKRAVIITQAFGSSNKAAQKDVKTSLNWLGITHVKTLGFRLMQSIHWNEISQKKKDAIEEKVRKFASGYTEIKKGRKGLKVRILFAIVRQMHKSLRKKGKPGADTVYWIEKGWI